MSVPAVEPPEPVDFETAIEATAFRLKSTFNQQPGAVPYPRLQEGARTAWELLYGQLRGRIPYPVPPDLLGVAVSASQRIVKGFATNGVVVLAEGRVSDIGDLRPWSGFMVVEKIVINRYRQRTA